MQAIKAENLVFLISQPRSGSSMLQQLLINSGEVISIPEPWFMLSLVYVYKKNNMIQEYNPSYAYINFMRYLDNYKGATDRVKTSIRETALKFYNFNHLQDHQKFFLDKTPRYYHIMDELMELFPEAKFIILSRNPISVFASILDYNFSGNVNALFRQDRLDDLLKAPRVISHLKKSTYDRDNIFFTRYEDIVKNPDASISEIYRFLGLECKTGENIHYNLNDNFLCTDAIDKKSLARHNHVVADYIDAWKQSIDDLQKKSLLLEYVGILGETVFENLGYDYAGALDNVKQHKVAFRLPVKWDQMEVSMEIKPAANGFYINIVSWINRVINRFSILRRVKQCQ